MNYFSTLNAINVNGKTAKKGRLTYLSWPWAWGEVKKLHPDATYAIYENMHGWNYHTDGRTCWVKTGVTVNGIEHIEYLPVMDNQNKSIPLERVNSYDVNKTIQRSLTKAVARHGLGLYIYAGEDLPEEAGEDLPEEAGEDLPEEDDRQDDVEKAQNKPGERTPPPEDAHVFCEECGKRYPDYWDGKRLIKAAEWSSRQRSMFGRALCKKCSKEINK